nr:MAG TPA: zinc finger protein [Caudoviricetes sp.]DAM62453.1 MAG TPA: zinc finger protein [Caudoviricetes sp.]
MKRDEIVTALRCCASSEADCKGNCAFFGTSSPNEDCSQKKNTAAADLIENQQRHIEALMQANAALRELAEADKNGRVVVLPCKVGDTVWVTSNPWTGKLLKKPLDAYVNGIKKFSHGVYVNVLFDTKKINGTRDYEINHIGKTVFLTREEAEKALEAMKNE